MVKSLLGTVDASLQASVKAATRRRTLLERHGGERCSAWRLLSDGDGTSSALQQAEDIVGQFRSFAADSLLPGQEAVEIVLPQFRILVQKLSLLSLADDATGAARNLSFAAPSLPLETLNGQLPGRISLPVAASVDPSLTSLSVSVTSTRSELFNIDQGLSGSRRMFSSPLTVVTSGSLCTGDDCRVQIVLPTAPAITEYTGPPPPAEKHDTYCAAGDLSSTEVTCSSGATQTVTCDGTESTVTTECPVTSYVPTCSDAGAPLPGCVVESFTESSITCSCPVPAQSSVRRLQGTDDSEESSGTSSVSYVAMLGQVETNFVTTVTSAQSLSYKSTIQGGWTALVTVGSIAFAIVYALVWSYRADLDEGKVVPLQTKLMRQASKASKTKGQNTTWKTRASQEKVDKDMQIAEAALPMILSSNSLSKRVKEELKTRHKWFGIIFNYNQSFPRVLRVLSTGRA
jgi:hypothetical protein